MRAAGYEPEDFDVDIFEVWPENWPQFNLFCAVQTQWRVGMGGATGLDYTAVFATMDRLHMDKTDAERDAMFCDLQAMERIALEEMTKK